MTPETTTRTADTGKTLGQTGQGYDMPEMRPAYDWHHRAGRQRELCQAAARATVEKPPRDWGWLLLLVLCGAALAAGALWR